PELAFIYGLGGVAFGCADMVCGGFDRLGPAIQSGTFDRVLTRPVGVFAQTLGADFQLRRLGRISQALLVFIIAIRLLDLEWTPLKVLAVVTTIASGLVIFAGIWVIGAAITFWTVQTSEITNIFTYGGSELARWPI